MNFNMITMAQNNSLTAGSKAWMIAYPQNGEFTNCQVIRAETEQDAINKYMKINKYIIGQAVNLGPVQI